MSVMPGPVYGLEVPPGEILIPASMDFPASFRITMAAVDPTEEAEPDEEGNTPALPRSTLRLVKRAFPALDDDDEDELDEEYMQALLEGDDDEDEDEEANGGPSDPAKSKKQKQAAAIKKLLEATKADEDDDEDEDEEMADAKPNGVKNKGKAKALDEDDEDEDDEDSEDDEEGADLENFVICTLDTERNYQQPLDITVNHGEKVFFVVTGTHTIYLTGNYIMDDEDDEDEDEDEDDEDYDPDMLQMALEGGLDEDEESDDLDDVDDPRVTELDDDEEEAPKLVATKKGKNKRAAEEGAETLDDLIAKAEDPKLSKKQQKKLKNNKGEAVAAEEKKDAKSDKKVQFAKNLEQGPTGSGKANSKASVGVKVVQGVTIDDRTIGSGRTVKSGDSVGVRYIGKLQNGNVFDSNKKGKPFSFKAGKGQVIKGWDIGVIGMAVGGERRLTIPAHLAYGSKALPGIPANSTLIFDVKLLEINYPPPAALPKHVAVCSDFSGLSETDDRESQADLQGAKLCRASSRMWSPSPARKGNNTIDRQTHEHVAAEPAGEDVVPKNSAIDARPSNLATASNNTVVQRKPALRGRPSLQALSTVLSTTPSSDGSSGLSSLSKFSLIEKVSTGKTSLDSRFSSPSKESAERRFPRRNPRTRSSPEGAALGTIIESGLDQAQPTVSTVEKAAAVKIYFETHFNELLHRPDTRTARQQQMESQLYYSPHLSLNQKNAIRQSFYYNETCSLRENRVLRAQSEAVSRGKHDGLYVDRYEPLKILGKGSFGVVRLVRERCASKRCAPKQIFAMKVIRKSDMLRSSQEGHLRAERDFLVASEGSEWIVPLVASFQDISNLYLVMEYMPGGDFLGLLIRENILHETVARFYIAEMILAVEEAHRLKCIHRDIKPDNFLISASGHLKLSDFGLAFDGHWSHDSSYYNCHRYSLLRKLGVNVDGDDTDQKESRNIHTQLKWAQSLMSGLERHEKRDASSDEDLGSLLHWRNGCGNRTSANSVVGTSQYMAPESVGIILYECLYGHTPFLSEEGRQKTKENIVEHKTRFYFPQHPLISDKCKDLIYRLMQDKEGRLCAKGYFVKDQGQLEDTSGKDPSGRYVFPNDAEDIKAHRWFKNVPWDRLQTMSPPFVPHIHSDDDTHYFDESEPITDWSDSTISTAMVTPDDVRSVLVKFREEVRALAVQLVAVPYDSAKLRQIDSQIDTNLKLLSEEKEILKHFVRLYGKKERKRPRDRLLRDEKTKQVVMDVRKQTAFMGYGWRRLGPDRLMFPVRR
ncbi:hypothetical protein S7711_00918 [Stachybotrys chartarum IBT 7711]|uniref:peptidylprolyl isomerase n=1 Tax=Stachybotrys chartarum (strain CBS 109288 / IBT 7711) TaxID=1280523 RepID=A0A084B0L7_STACB|nr:hypothetical protein S7711_00918 [Stachybotrys chartarum IBT 7711]